MNARSALLFVTVLGYGVLWVGGVLSYSVMDTSETLQRAAGPAFLWVAAVVSISTAPGKQRMQIILAAAAAFGVEAVGVATGMVFGSYRYDAALGLRLLGVPSAIMAAWLILLAYVWNLISRWNLPRAVAALLGALWMVGIDLVIDPLAAGPLGFWRWTEPGWYYGIPFSNFAGWYLLSLLLLGLLRSERYYHPPSHVVGWSIVLFFTLVAGFAGFVLPLAVGAALLLLDGYLYRTRWKGYFGRLNDLLIGLRRTRRANDG